MHLWHLKSDLNERKLVFYRVISEEALGKRVFEGLVKELLCFRKGATAELSELDNDQSSENLILGKKDISIFERWD